MAVQVAHREHKTLSVLDGFQTINLQEMNKAKLMNRIDHKFLLNTSQLFGILDELKKHFSALSIDGVINQNYTSVYYDTVSLKMYHDHHTKRADRFKIRQRMYNTSGDSFLEIKHKNNKGYTKKTRIATNGMFDKIPYVNFDFIKENTPYPPFALKKVVENNFNRFTLTNKDRTQRITIDTDISFWYNNKPMSLDNLVIAEVKSDRNNFDKTIFELFKANGIHPNGMSKYSIGLAMMQPDLKQNNFKQKIHTVKKISHAI